jgi:NAD(P)-dependent dehydrogenase (short-subunit alcohol dehydrogenase family)
VQVNHLAPFLLTNLLLPTLAASHATVINTSSAAAKRLAHLDLADLENERGRDMLKAYGDAKLDNILFTHELHRRYGTAGINTVAFHPGNVASGFASDTTSSWRFIYNTPLRRVLLISPERGAETLLWLAGSTPGVDWQPGAFYIKHKPATSSPQADDAELAAALWERSARMVGLAEASPTA